MAVTVTNDASTFRRTANLPGLTSFSLFGWYKFSAVTPGRFWGPMALMSAIDGAAGRTISSFASGSAQLVIEYTNSGGSFVSNAILTVSANTWYFIALTSAGNAIGNLTGYIRARTDNAFTKISNSAAMNTFTPGAIDFGREGFTGEFMSGDMHGIGVADVALSEDELLRLSYFHEPHRRGIRSLNCFWPCIESVNTNATLDRSGNARNATSTVGALADGPPILWKPLPVWPLPIAAATGAISGTTTLTLSPSGTLEGAGALSGSATLTLSPSGTLGGAGALSGTATLTLSPSGTIAGAGALSGTATLTLSPSGTIAGAGALSGTATLTLSPSGTLAGAGALSGTATLTLSPSGTLAGGGALSGTATLTLSPSGTIAGAGALSGTATLTLSPSGTLAGAGALSGSLSLSLVLEGNVAPADSLAGNIALALSPSGTIAGAGSMSGSATLTLSPSGTLRGAGALSGSTTLTLSPSGTIAGFGYMSGSASLTFTASGTLEEPTQGLVGAIGLSLSAAGTLSADAAIAGSLSIVISLSGQLGQPCDDLVVDKRHPDTDDLVAVAFLTDDEAFAKTDEEVAIVRLFYLSSYCDPVVDLTSAEYRALPRATRLALWDAPSAAGLIDTEGKSNA